MGNCISCFRPEDKRSKNTQMRPTHSELRPTSPSELPVPFIFKLQRTFQKFIATRRQTVTTKATAYAMVTPHTHYTEAATAVVTHRTKSSLEKKLVRNALLSHFIFKGLEAVGIEFVVHQMKHFALDTQQIVLTQGTLGEYFFVVDSGTVEIIVNGTVKATLGTGTSFGELALIHNSVRTATVRTVGHTELWGITRETVQNTIKTVSSKKYQENRDFIESVPLFKGLAPEERDSLLTVIVSQQFSDGQKIISEGDPGDMFYIIKEGTVLCSKQGVQLRELAKGEFFGEQALLYNTGRTASVHASGNVSVLSLGREHLTSVLGDSLQRTIYRNTLRIAMEQNNELEVLTKAQIEGVIEQMDILLFPQGETVIPEMTMKEESLWVVVKGELCTAVTGVPVTVYQCIGMGNTTHNENYVASTEVTVAVIQKTVLENVIGGPLKLVSSKNQAISILRSVNLLKCLPTGKIEQLTSVLTTQTFGDSEVIFRENDLGNAFYIVKEGQVDIVKNGAWIRTIGKNDFFGERSILLNDNRTATVVARKRAVCWVLNKTDFLMLVEEGLRTQLLERMELQNDRILLKDLAVLRVLGKGMFGNVFLTRDKTKNVKYALKSVSRMKIAAFSLYEGLALERKLLLQLDHPFIMKLVKTFKDSKRVYFLMEYVKGMDLFDVLREMPYVTDDAAQFYVGCLILTLEHLHGKNIIYRDLKPENIMISEDGYQKLIDFGTGKVLNGRTYTTVGTPHYMAPEVITGNGYCLSADVWSLGVMLYEFLYGFVPFGDEYDDPYMVYESVVKHNVQFYECADAREEAVDIIQQMLNVTPSLRGNHCTLKKHPWFLGMNWDRLLAKQVVPPFVPTVNTEPSVGKRDSSVSAVIGKEEGKDCVKGQWRHSKTDPAGWDMEF